MSLKQMSLKWIWHKNGNVTKLEISLMEMAHKFKCHKNGNVIKMEMSLKFKFH